jgi:hypothetical protein
MSVQQEPPIPDGFELVTAEPPIPDGFELVIQEPPIPDGFELVKQPQAKVSVGGLELGGEEDGANPEVDKSNLKAAGAGVLGGLIKAPKSVANVLDTLSLPLAHAYDAVLGPGYVAAQRGRIDKRATEMQAVDEALATATQGDEGARISSLVGSGVGQALVEVLPQVSIALLSAGSSATAQGSATAGLWASSVVGGLQSGAQTFDVVLREEMQKNPELTRDEAEGRALIPAFNSALITTGVTKAFGATGLESILRVDGTKGVVKKVLGVLREAGFEGLEEATDTVAQDLAERLQRNPDKPIKDTLLEVFLAGTVGSILGGKFKALSLAVQGAEPGVKEKGNVELGKEISQSTEASSPEFTQVNEQGGSDGLATKTGLEGQANLSNADVKVNSVAQEPAAGLDGVSAVDGAGGGQVKNPVKAKWTGPAMPQSSMGYDVLDLILENGGLRSPGRKPGPEYDDLPDFRGVYKSKLFGGKVPPDVMAMMGKELGMGDGTVPSFWVEVDKAMRGRDKMQVQLREMAKEDRAQVQGEKRARLRFSEFFLQKREGGNEVVAADLRPGDVLVSGDLRAVVTEVDEAGGLLVVDAGEQGGLQVLNLNQKVYADAVTVLPPEDLTGVDAPFELNGFPGDEPPPGFELLPDPGVDAGQGRGNGVGSGGEIKGINESTSQAGEDAVTRTVRRAPKAEAAESAEGYLRRSIEAVRGFAETGEADPIELQRQLLIRWGEVRGFLPAPKGAPNASGAEHVVYFSAQNSSVVKVTMPYHYGVRLVPGAKAVTKNLTALEYLQRLDLSRVVFDDDVRVLGVTRDGRVVTEQQFYLAERLENPHPSQQEVDDFMREAGFKRVDGGLGMTWQRSVDGVMVSDVRRENFILTKAGLMPVDVSIWRAKDDAAARVEQERQDVLGEMGAEDAGPYSADAPLVISDAGSPYLRQELRGMDRVSIIAMPELVDMVWKLTGSVPFLKKFKKSRGIFHASGKGSIGLDGRIFLSPVDAAKTLAHEIGHLLDYLPDLNLNRGNLLGRLGSLGKYLKTTLPPLPDQAQVTGGALTEADRRSIRKAARVEVVEKFGPQPQLEDEQDRKLWNEAWRRKYEEKLEEEIKKRGLIRAEVIRAELEGLLTVWKPIPANAPQWYVDYRLSSTELYADAVSVLFNSPELLAERAPVFYTTFWHYLDQKKEVKAVFLEVQALLQKDLGELVDARSVRMRAAFEKGDEIFWRKWEEAKARRLSWRGWMKGLKSEVYDRYNPIIRRFRSVQALGVKFSGEDRLDWFFDSHPLGDNKVFIWLQKVQGEVLSPLAKADIDRNTFGEYLYFNRVANEHYGREVEDGLGVEISGRRTLANPGGHTPETARLQLDVMRKSMGPRWAVMEEAGVRYHKAVLEVFREATEMGLFSQKMFDEVIVPNSDYYATFVPLKYWDLFVPAGIVKQAGTLDDVANPLPATTLKVIGVMRAAQDLQSKKRVIDFLKRYMPTEIKQAEMVWTTDGKRPVEPKNKSMALLEIRVDGKLEAWEVAAEIAQMFEHVSPEHMSTSVRVLGMSFRQYLYPLFIRFNPAFQLFSSPAMDNMRWLVNVPAKARAKVGAEYLSEFYNFWARPGRSVIRKRLGMMKVFGINDGSEMRSVLEPPGPEASAQAVAAWELNLEMLKVGAIWSPFDSFARSTGDHDSYAVIMEKFHLFPESQKWKWLENKWLTPVTGFFRRVEFIGQLFENLPKVATYKVFTKDLGMPKDEAVNYVQNHVGVPNFMKRGRNAWMWNSVMPFTTVFINGLESDVKLATGKVKSNSAGHWWLSWAVFGGGAYRVMQTLAEEGLFGEWLEEFFKGVSPHDKEQGLIVPVGTVPGGSFGQRVAYLRMPEDETSRLINGLLRYGIKASFSVARGEGLDGNQWAAFGFTAGQVPSINPLLEITKGWSTYLSGNNPIDSYSNRPVLSLAEQSTRGVDAAVSMMGWTMDKSGLTNFFKWNRYAETTTEAVMGAIPGINRLIKVTDAGYRAGQRELGAELDKENHKLRLQMPKDVQALVSEYIDLRSIKKDLRTREQTLRYHQLSIWYNSLYSPLRETMVDMDADDRKVIREHIRSISSPFIN